MSDGAMTQLPRWKCHKEVWAAKIRTIDMLAGTTFVKLGLDFGRGFEDAYELLPLEWSVKHRPEVGGYYVQYADGHKSYSPAAAFEEGYTRIA